MILLQPGKLDQSINQSLFPALFQVIVKTAIRLRTISPQAAETSGKCMSGPDHWSQRW